MYVLILYQLPKSKRWRWKLIAPNGKIIARADYHYRSMSHAERSFKSMFEGLKKNPTSVSIVRGKNICYWREL